MGAGSRNRNGRRGSHCASPRGCGGGQDGWGDGASGCDRCGGRWCRRLTEGHGRCGWSAGARGGRDRCSGAAGRTRCGRRGWRRGCRWGVGKSRGGQRLRSRRGAHRYRRLCRLDGWCLGCGASRRFGHGPVEFGQLLCGSCRCRAGGRGAGCTWCGRSRRGRQRTRWRADAGRRWCTGNAWSAGHSGQARCRGARDCWGWRSFGGERGSGGWRPEGVVAARFTDRLDLPRIFDRRGQVSGRTGVAVIAPQLGRILKGLRRATQLRRVFGRGS
jgi:hypothetical protein